MVVIVADGNERLLSELEECSARVIIFIVGRLHTRLVNRVCRLAQPKLKDAGNLVIAESLPQAMERL